MNTVPKYLLDELPEEVRTLFVCFALVIAVLTICKLLKDIFFSTSSLEKKKVKLEKKKLELEIEQLKPSELDSLNKTKQNTYNAVGKAQLRRINSDKTALVAILLIVSISAVFIVSKRFNAIFLDIFVPSYSDSYNLAIEAHKKVKSSVHQWENLNSQQYKTINNSVYDSLRENIRVGQFLFDKIDYDSLVKYQPDFYLFAKTNSIITDIIFADINSSSIHVKAALSSSKKLKEYLLRSDTTLGHHWIIDTKLLYKFDIWQIHALLISARLNGFLNAGEIQEQVIKIATPLGGIERLVQDSIIVNEHSIAALKKLKLIKQYSK